MIHELKRNEDFSREVVDNGPAAELMGIGDSDATRHCWSIGIGGNVMSP
jgi:hypothetical protein